ncbi:hypothetical protein QTV49_004899 [Vibrio vulnificus]|nr:hypothetical protein [Vibrio vulnificus]
MNAGYIALDPELKKILINLGVETRIRPAFGYDFEIPMHINAVEPHNLWQLRFNRKNEPKFSTSQQICSAGDRVNIAKCMSALNSLTITLIKRITNGYNSESHRLSRTREKPSISVTVNKKGCANAHLFIWSAQGKTKTISKYLGTERTITQDRIDEVCREMSKIWAWRRTFVDNHGLKALYMVDVPKEVNVEPDPDTIPHIPMEVVIDTISRRMSTYSRARVH